MIQSALIFAFGFVAAALLAFMIAPTIWRRAVYLTRKRIDSSLPLTVNELNAEKDVLRAQHAMELRRIEMRLEKLHDHDIIQKASIADHQASIKALEGKLADSVARGKELDRNIEDLNDKLNERTTELSETSISLESTRTELSVRTDELHALSRHFDDATRRLEDANSDIDYKDGQIDMLTNSVSELKGIRKDNQKQIRELQSGLNANIEMLNAERKRSGGLEEKLQQTIGRNSDLEVRIERREKELERLREQLQVADAEFREMEGRATEAEQEKRSLEGELGELTARVNGLIAMADGREPEDAVQAYQEEVAQQASQIADLSADRDALRERIGRLQMLVDGQEPEEGIGALAAEAERQKQELSTINAERYALKTEIAEMKGRIERLMASLGGEEPEKAIEALQAELGRQKSELTVIATERDGLQGRTDELTARLDQLRSSLGDVEPEEGFEDLAAHVDRQGRQLEKLTAERGALEGEIGKMRDRIRGLMASMDGKQPEEALSDLTGQLSAHKQELAAALSERDALKGELGALQAAPQPAGDAALRDKLNQLAAEVVAMAAKLEGPQSRINALLSGDQKSSVSDIVSLADRIKELQRRSGAQPAHEDVTASAK